MFSDICLQLKGFAKITLGIGLILSAVFSIQFGVLGIATFIIGALASWVNTCVLYAFAELVERVIHMEEMMKANSSHR